jgi:2-phospho-L-lactate/phosphoenolpyruvate guanylyltransferase
VPTAAILPIKRFDQAKKRLSEALGASTRETLAAAMFADVLAQIRRAASLDAVMVVSGEPRVQALAAEAGATLIDDPAEQGQSQATLTGLARVAAEGFDRALLVPGDCPLVDPVDLDLLVQGLSASQDVVIVRDRHGTGTNALLLGPAGPFEPQFGPGSLARHVQQAEDKGLNHSVATLFSLGLDVDTDDDLEQLVTALDGVRDRAVSTRAVLSRIGRISSAAA